MMDFILEHREWIIAVNFLLVVAVKYIVKLFSAKNDTRATVFKFRLINYAFIVILLFTYVFKEGQELFSGMFLALFTVYVAAIVYEVMAYLILHRLGGKVDGKPVENHNTRIMTLLSLVFLIFFTIVVLIKIWGFDSALETTGFIGIVLGFLAFTSSIWAPDLVSGVLLLHSSLISDGDTIVVGEKKYKVWKFGFFETVLIDVYRNNRTILKNSKLRDESVSNLDRVAGTTGLREFFTYTIPYKNDMPYEDYFRVLDEAVQKVQTSFYEKTKRDEKDDKSAYVNQDVNLDFSITNPGNYGIDITLGYYIKDLKNCQTAGKLREVFNKTRSEFHKSVLVEFQKKGIFLDTPLLVAQAEVSQPGKEVA